MISFPHKKKHGKNTRSEGGSFIKKEKSSRFGKSSSRGSSHRSEAHLDPEIFIPDNILMSTNWSPYDEFKKNKEKATALELVLHLFKVAAQTFLLMQLFVTFFPYTFYNDYQSIQGIG